MWVLGIIPRGSQSPGRPCTAELNPQLLGPARSPLQALRDEVRNQNGVTQVQVPPTKPHLTSAVRISETTARFPKGTGQFHWRDKEVPSALQWKKEVPWCWPIRFSLSVSGCALQMEQLKGPIWFLFFIFCFPQSLSVCKNLFGSALIFEIFVLVHELMKFFHFYNPKHCQLRFVDCYSFPVEAARKKTKTLNATKLVKNQLKSSLLHVFPRVQWIKQVTTLIFNSPTQVPPSSPRSLEGGHPTPTGWDVKGTANSPGWVTMQLPRERGRGGESKPLPSWLRFKIQLTKHLLHI